ncbi:bacillithiol system redox-active protein YtxJ [Flavobacterium sp. AG291]|uniref:bacillithiol system redox-active protein YtxJ n=1 Tax=Flavobacterium sp. AG291 TaxID=2184000 RepID=UPI000E0B4569|nr:bacillithiol system redox-active protein YtxJ [Flavobacterium sp. AG291]RDI04445.1 bacillithiol system protein YtxJ [Flavobacterium sp. AG291]
MGIIAKHPGHYYLDYQSEPITEWTDLISLEQLEGIIDESYSITIVIFKHSTRCDMSSALLKNFERRYNAEDTIPKPYFLDLIAHRDISNEIELRFDIKHESPQVIFVKDGVVVKHASHREIVEIEFSI